MKEILLWPLREVLLRYVFLLREKTLAKYNLDVQVWASKTAFGGSTKPPKVPDLLR